MPNDSDVGKAINFTAAAAVAVYLFMVWYQGNTKAFASTLFSKSSIGFVEWLVAIYALYFLLKVKELQPISGALVSAAIVGVTVKAMSGSNASAAFEAFGSGQVGIFGLVKKLFEKDAG